MRALWIAGTERPLPPGPERSFSEHTLWLAGTAGGEGVVLKRFADAPAWRRECAAYERYAHSMVESTPCIGQGVWLGSPVLVLRRLRPAPWSSDSWSGLLTQAFLRISSIRVARVPEAAGGHAVPRRTVGEMLEPLRLRLQVGASLPALNEDDLYSLVQDERDTPFVFSHGDLHTPNTMLDAQGQLHLVDWERCAWLPCDADTATITVSLAIRQPEQQLSAILNAVQPHVRAQRLFAALVLSEIVCLIKLFRDDITRSRVLTHLFERLSSRKLEDWTE